ncbi:hypothetical protein BKA70DRAFT_34346 [Coprinopsis sp. MPI-PUGE-AT-0042]|nr:hypothetical protein BKA70DRAFT_34346 [Coprinopsis sp. MPI-PUGE-AT-0042]
MAPQIEMPMNTANHHAAVAEEYQAQGMIVLAAEEHQKAADALLAAIERSTDESAKRTLRLLYNRHCKDRDDLRRRIQKLQDEGKDPNLPQRADVPASSTRHTSNGGSSSSTQNPVASASQQMYPRPTMSDSNTVDESFMVLGGQRSDPGDAFNQFWSVLQGMLDNISQPVAFATAPLNTLDMPSDDVAQSSAQAPPPPPQHTYPSLRREHGVARDSDDDHLLSRWTKKIGISLESSRPSIHDVRSKGKGSSSSFDEDEFDEFLEEDDLSGSFFLIPEQSAATLRKENAALKTELLATQEKLKGAEHLLKLRKEQDLQLRNSIFEAQRAMSASGMLPRQAGGDTNAINFGKVPQAAPAPPAKPNREAQYTKRIKELEDELRNVKAENEKNKLMIVKFRERWEKLKESAKRKKEAKSSGESGQSVRNQKIVEEPEAEEELDGTNG